MKGEWIENFTIRGYEVDFKNQMTVSSIFNYLQIAAGNHADNIEYGFKALKEKGLYWVLSRMKVKIYNYPPYGTKVSLKTWPKGTDKIFALRDFVMYDETGKKILEATSAWIILDIKTKMPKRLKELPDEFFINKDKNAIEEIPAKIKVPNEINFSYNRRVGYTQIDLNCHVNNEKYVEWALDAFDKEMYFNKQIDTIQVNFLSECKIGDIIKINKGCYKQQSNSCCLNTYVEGCKEERDKKVFQAQIKWKNNK